MVHSLPSSPCVLLAREQTSQSINLFGIIQTLPKLVIQLVEEPGQNVAANCVTKERHEEAHGN